MYYPREGCAEEKMGDGRATKCETMPDTSGKPAAQQGFGTGSGKTRSSQAMNAPSKKLKSH